MDDSHVCILFVIADMQPVNPESSIAEEVWGPPQHILVIARSVIDHQLGRCSHTKPISCSTRSRAKDLDASELQ